MRGPSIDQVAVIVRLQKRFNRHVDEHWLEKPYPFMRAVVVEVAEALDHYGWKWWSTQQRRLDQVTIELIDILGLLVSDVLQRCDGQDERATQQIVRQCAIGGTVCELDGASHNLEQCGVPDLLDLLAALAVCRRNSFGVLTHLFERMSLTWDDIVRQFCAKTALNVFRQDQGYGSGVYQKVWNDVEDNEHLSNVLLAIESRDVRHDTVFDAIYQELVLRYRACVRDAAGPTEEAPSILTNSVDVEDRSQT
jgi:hypothetical protein